MDNDGVLMEILKLSKESAASDAEIKADIKNINKRIDGQDVTLKTMAEQIAQQAIVQRDLKALQQEVIANKSVINELQKKIDELQNRPQQTLWNTYEKIKWLVVSALSGAVVTYIISVVSKGGK